MTQPSEFCVEYPNGEKVYIDEDGRPTHHVAPYAPVIIPFAEALEVLPDPFPAAPSSAAWQAFESALAKFDATTRANARETHAASDALLAIIALQKACMRMIETDTPINQAECLTFVDFARQRLQVVAAAVPMLKVGP